jgi:hypothetical protein
MKKSDKVLLYFGLDCGMLEFFTYIFLEHCSVEKIAVWAHANRDPCKQAEGWNHFCVNWLRTLNSYQMFKIKNKKIKTYSG